MKEREMKLSTAQAPHKLLMPSAEQAKAEKILEKSR